MKAICRNCIYLGWVIGKGLVCGQTKNFESVKLDGTCERYTQDVCESCGSDGSNYIDIRRFSPYDKLYIIRTEYKFNSCGSFWWIDI